MANISISGAYRAEPFVFKSPCCIRCGNTADCSQTVNLKVPKRSSRIVMNLPFCSAHTKVLIGNWTVLLATLSSIFGMSLLVAGRLWRVIPLSPLILLAIELLQLIAVIAVWAYLSLFAIRVSIVHGRLHLRGVAQTFVDSAVIVESMPDPSVAEFVDDWKDIN
jgi:hypothetical protein